MDELENRKFTLMEAILILRREGVDTTGAEKRLMELYKMKGCKNEQSK